jgi:RimJ/RimL family protein N-acetyltransferase
LEIRRAGAADWEVVRDLRLRALADAPQAFGSSYEREVAFADIVWIDRVGTTTNATLVYESDGHACGIVTLVRDQHESGVAWLVGMWVAPSVRGTGAADALVAAVLQWAGDHDIGAVRLHVAEGNARAEHLYRRHDFTRTGRTLSGARPGLVEIEMQRAARNT